MKLRPGRTRGAPRAEGLAAVAAVLVILAACTLEQRSDGTTDRNGVVPADTFQAEQRGLDPVPGAVRPEERDERAATPEEAVLTTLDVFREAVRVGDLSLALSLLHRDAVLSDDLAGAFPETTTRGEILMELRRRHAEGLRLEPMEHAVHELDGALLVHSRWQILHRGEEGGEPDVRGEARESAVLRPSIEGWRIALFHRSRLPDS